MLTWGKGMGGDLPMAGLTYKEKIGESLAEGSQPGTFAGNALGCVVSLTNLDILTDPRANLIGRAGKLGEEVKRLFQDAAKKNKLIGEVRGLGLMIGVEVVADKKTRQPLEPSLCGEIAMKLLNSGVIMVPCGRYGNVFRFMPPLTITRELAFKASEIFLSILKKY
jgi:4-aminobutyrate aminotransferase